MIELDGRCWLVRGESLLAWGPGGYGESRPARGPVTVITPRATVAVLAAGYQPALHPSALLSAIYLDTRWSRNILLSVTEALDQRRSASRILGIPGVVTDIDQITPRMRRVRIEGPELTELTSVPGQHVRVRVADPRDPRNWLRPRDILRTYSIWRHDDGLELCALDHGGDGPGERWTRSIRVGDTVYFGRPEGSFALRGEDTYHVFAGEETAAVAFGAMLRALPANVPAHGVIEVAEPADRLPLDRELRWLYRHGQPAASSETLVNALAELPLPSAPGIAYLAGEARTIQMLRRHLVSERGWPRQSVRTKPFWTPGKRGLD